MKSAKTWIATGFLLAASVAPAMAADWGGVKDMGGGVPIPVPAPAPVPTFDADSDWYVGLMLGGNISRVEGHGYGYGLSGTSAADQRTMAKSPCRRSYGLTFGRYITPSLRWEIAVDYTPDTRIYAWRNVGLRCGELRAKSIAERRLLIRTYTTSPGQIP